MRVTVTGSAGFLGSAVVTELLRGGTSVIGIDRRRRDALPGELVLSGDLLDRDELVATALATTDAVIHLAGAPGVRDTGPDAALRRRRDNVAATARVLDAVPFDVPVVVASSSSVYGGSSGCASREDDRLAPRGDYARSKVAVESLCVARARHGGRVTVVRPFTVVGEGQRPDMAVARWLAAAAAGRPLEVYGSTSRTRDLTDVRDVARALASLADPSCAPTGVLNIGTGRPHSLGAVLDAVRRVADADVPVVEVAASAVEPPDTWADPTRLREVLGWAPQTDLLDVVSRQAAAARQAVAA